MMKISTQRLKEIIKEELDAAAETSGDALKGFGTGTSIVESPATGSGRRAASNPRTDSSSAAGPPPPPLPPVPAPAPPPPRRQRRCLRCRPEPPEEKTRAHRPTRTVGASSSSIFMLGSVTLRKTEEQDGV